MLKVVKASMLVMGGELGHVDDLDRIAGGLGEGHAGEGGWRPCVLRGYVLTGEAITVALTLPSLWMVLLMDMVKALGLRVGHADALDGEWPHRIFMRCAGYQRRCWRGES